MKKIVHAACPHDCPDACGVLITVEGGRATKIQGDPAHPVTRGFLCAKVAKYLHRVYSPDRVLYPMRRVRAKGPEPDAPSTQTRSNGSAGMKLWIRFVVAFATLSPNLAARRFCRTLTEAPWARSTARSMDRRFFHRMGASRLERNICSAAGEAGPQIRRRSHVGDRA